jgi:hypothetical protein
MSGRVVPVTGAAQRSSAPRAPYALATSDHLADTARQVEPLDRRAWTAAAMVLTNSVAG